MADSGNPPPRPPVVAWLVAAFGGITVAVTLALIGPGRAASPLIAAVTGVAAGLVVTFAAAPWRALAAERARRRRLRAMTEAVERVARGEEGAPLRGIDASGDPDLDRLGRAVHAALRAVLSDRRSARRLERTMGDSIRRATHRETVRLRREAATDPLTGLGNRRALDQALHDLRTAEHPPASVVAMLVDMDRFKQVNDALGHDVGDRCLAFLGELLVSGVRREDTAVRLGGDEFLVLMPGETRRGARHVAERLRRLFNQMPWSHGGAERPTLSIGVACVRHDELGDGRALLRRADEALYRAKHGGRGRVVVHGEEEPVAA